MKPKTNDIWVLIDGQEENREQLYEKLMGEAASIAEETKGKLYAAVPFFNDAFAKNTAQKYAADAAVCLKGPEYESCSPEVLRLAFFHLINKYAPLGVVLPDTKRGRAIAEKMARKLKIDSTVGYAIFGLEEEEEDILWKNYNGKEGILVSNTSPFIALCSEPSAEEKTDTEDRSVKTIYINEEFHVLTEARGDVLSSALKAAAGSIKALNPESRIVSGGKGLGSRECFEALIPPLVDALGAIIGSSRAAVDSGWVPYSYQIGKTSRIVSPDLYVACGISGSIQHRNGMSGSKYVFAVNNDYNAPIFDIAAYGIVGDVKKILPILTDIIKTAGQP